MHDWKEMISAGDDTVISQKSQLIWPELGCVGAVAGTKESVLAETAGFHVFKVNPNSEFGLAMENLFAKQTISYWAILCRWSLQFNQQTNFSLPFKCVCLKMGETKKNNWNIFCVVRKRSCCTLNSLWYNNMKETNLLIIWVKKTLSKQIICDFFSNLNGMIFFI